MQPHEHKYTQGDIGELCDVCGLLRSTIEGVPTIRERIEESEEIWETFYPKEFGKISGIITILTELHDRLSALEEYVNSKKD